VDLLEIKEPSVQRVIQDLLANQVHQVLLDRLVRQVRQVRWVALDKLGLWVRLATPDWQVHRVSRVSLGQQEPLVIQASKVQWAQ
jgi:hypothetical protein